MPKHVVCVRVLFEVLNILILFQSVLTVKFFVVLFVQLCRTCVFVYLYIILCFNWPRAYSPAS